MSATNFNKLIPEQKIVWSRDVWQDARDATVFDKFMGGKDSLVQSVNELTKTERGDKALMQLVADLQKDGIVGDNAREGFEEALTNDRETITIDLLSHGVVNTGKMADQRSVINFREEARDKLGYWLGNRITQLGFLTLSGIAYTYNTDGSLRVDSNLPDLAFATDVSAPTSGRHYRWDAVTGLEAGDTTAIDPADTLTYRAIVDICTEANVSYLKPFMEGGKEYYVAFMDPASYAQLKKDDDFQRAIVQAGGNTKSNPWFTGGIVTVDGLVIHTHKQVFNTRGATSGVGKWGAGADVDATRTLICGPQALGMAKLGMPEWNEETFEYKSRHGINIDLMFGMVKPKFKSIYHSNTVQDFGVIALDHAL